MTWKRWPSHVEHLAFAFEAFVDPRTVHTQLLKLHHCSPSLSLWNKLLKLYVTSGLSHLAGQVLDKMPERDVVSYNTMITAYVRSHSGVVNAVDLYSRMRDEKIGPNSITLSALLIASNHIKCFHFVEQIHAQVVRVGLSSNAFVGSALVNGYERSRNLHEAIRVFEDISELDLVSWNIMIDACARRNSKWHTAETFSRMRRCSSESFDGFSLTSVLKTCLDKVDLILGMQLHCCALKAGLESETPCGNALITMYSKCENEMDSSMKVFDEIPQPNIISWTAVISGLVRHALAPKAISYYKKMLREGISENEFCFASLLPAYSLLARLEHGRQLHCRIVKSKFQSDIGVANGLVDMYFKCGSLEDAKLAFDTMKTRDRISWTVLILGFGQHGKVAEAIGIFRGMENTGFKPDEVTFLAILTACSHGGFITEGLQLFDEMVNGDHCRPRKEHYACIIDMLCRGGQFEKAKRIVENGAGAEAWAWEAMLGGCGKHGEAELGEQSAVKVMEMAPEKDGAYVLLANMYAEGRRWEEKSRVRQWLDDRGLRKEVGSSW